MAAQTLDGWGQFKFGMTVDEARATDPPASARNYGIVSNAGVSSLEFGGPIREFGSEFGAVELIFEADKRLGSIEFRNHKKVSAKACELSLQKLLATADAQYGSFAPLGNTHGSSIRGVSDTKSQYLYFAGPSAFFGTPTMMGARRIVGSRSIMVLVNHVLGRNDEDCFMQLFLQGVRARRLPASSSR